MIERFLLALLLCGSAASAQQWTAPVRGAWVRHGQPRPGDVLLVAPGQVAQIVISDSAPGPVQQAARFLAADIETLSGQRPGITNRPAPGRVTIHFVALDADPQAPLPQGASRDALAGKWEAYQVLTTPDGGSVWLIGADARGAAYAGYTLSERLGIDPLYLWTGFRPQRQPRLDLAGVNFFADSPAVKFRGLFHDDEDILPRPFDYEGHPLVIGNVPTEWYKRFFETALRLRLNMVAPYTRVHRRFEVQKLASDWGLFYTSHHYDILLSNPFGFHHFDLAQKRAVSGEWNWQSNRENMLKYWRAGVIENGALDCLWPVGLRGTDDYGYPFPKGTTAAEQDRVFQEAIQAEMDAASQLVPKTKGPPLFTFTLYGEMLDKYLAADGRFDMPGNVTLIWPDDNDGRMRALPRALGKWKHGVYYHLAYYGPVTKQSMHIVPPRRIANEFKKIIASGATEYALVNVSEMREFVREARMIAEICWDPKTALADTPLQPMLAMPLPNVPTAVQQAVPDAISPSADRYVRWFCAEYFGTNAAPDCVEAYRWYDELLDRCDRQWYAGDRVAGALGSLVKKFAKEPFAPARPQTLPTLEDLDARYRQAFAVMERAKSKMDRQQKQFFFENCELPLLITGRQTEAALDLVRAISEPDVDRAWTLCEQAMVPLEQLETDLARAERPPFERWYGETFIRNANTGLNLHRPYKLLRAFLSRGGASADIGASPPHKTDLRQFLPVVGSYDEARH